MKRDHPDAAQLARPLELPGPPEHIVRILRPLLTERRLARIDAVIAARTRSVVPVLDGVIDPHNIAAVLRSADAFGVQEVHLVGAENDYLASTRVTQGADRWLDVMHHEAPQDCVDSLHRRGFEVYLATMDGKVDPDRLSRVPRVAIVFGNEHSGISESMAAIADGRYSIPMHGFAQSLNVSVAAAITLFSARRGRPGDLEPPDRETLLARFLMLSVPGAAAVLERGLAREGR